MNFFLFVAKNQISIIQKALNHIQTKTKSANGTLIIKFIRISSESDLYRYQNAIRVIQGSGCYSYVGVQQFTPQDLSLGKGCEYHGTVVHEFMHALDNIYFD